MFTGAPQKPAKTASPRKVEANRKNAKLSTGPQTDEGKARSSQNSIKHGIFVKRFLNGARPETVADIEALTAGMWEHYQPVGMLEELLVHQAVVEIARYDRVLAFEHDQEVQTGHPILVVERMNRIMRYSTSASRALFRATQELERLQAVRQRREGSATSCGVESTAAPTAASEEQRFSWKAPDSPVTADNSAQSPHATVEEVDAA